MNGRQVDSEAKGWADKFPPPACRGNFISSEGHKPRELCKEETGDKELVDIKYTVNNGLPASVALSECRQLTLRVQTNVS